MGNQNEIEKLVIAALLTSIAIVIKLIFNYIPLPTQIKNIDLFLVFIILAGILMGPLYGGLVGLITDLVYIFVAGGNWGLFTVAHIIAGFTPGLIFMFLKYNKVTLVVSTLLTIILYFIVTTIALDITGWIPANIYTIVPRGIRTAIVFVPYLFMIHFLVTDQRLQNFKVYRDFKTKQEC